MFDVLAAIIDAIQAVLHLVINTVMGIVQLISLAFEFITYLTLVLGQMPAPLLAFAGLGISLSVILLLLGRN